jgi:hypothetical protein
MNVKQALFITACAVIGIVVPWFSVGMMFMGLAIGAFLSVMLSD